MSLFLFCVKFGHNDGWHPVGLINPLMSGTYVPCTKCVVCFLIVQCVLKWDLCSSDQWFRSYPIENVLKYTGMTIWFLWDCP